MKRKATKATQTWCHIWCDKEIVETASGNLMPVDIAKGCCEEVVWGGTGNPVPEMRECLQHNNIL